MLRVFSRPLMVLNTTVSPSRLTKITDDSRAPVGVRSSDHGYVRPVEHLAGDVIERHVHACIDQAHPEKESVTGPAGVQMPFRNGSRCLRRNH
jgi:hypothetical protein